MSILLKGIKNGLGQYTGIGELVPDEVAELTGNLKFKDGTEQTTAYDPTAIVGGVSTVFGRSGDVVAASGDYTAALVTNVPLAPLTSTNVQGALNELANMVTGLQGGLDFKGLLAFDDPDPAIPPATGASHYYIFKDEGTRSVGDATGAEVLVGDWLAYSRTTSKWVHLAYSARTANAAGVSYDPGTNTIITGDNVQTALDQVETALVDADSRLDALEANPAGGVTSFNARTGAVVPAAGDYTATQTTFTPTADIAATNVQAAIVEVSQKAFPFFDTNGTLKPISFI
jgi:hypothetical protein